MKYKDIELYKPMFPLDWEPVILYDLSQWINGKAFRKKDYSRSGIPVIKIAELNNGLGGNTQYAKIDIFDKKFYIEEGDLLFSWSGNPKTSIDIFRFKEKKGWLNQHIYKTIPNQNVDKDFFYYLMKYLKPHFEIIATNKQTTGLGHVTKGDLKNLKVRVPNKNDQKLIANILSSLDNKIENNNAIISNLEAQAQAIFKSWFIDFEPFQDGEFIDSELGEIPRGWEIGKLGDSFLGKLIKSGIKEFEDEKIYLATADVTDSNIINYDNKVTLDNRPSRANMQPAKNSVWFAKMKESRKLIYVGGIDDFLVNKVIFSTGFAGIQATELSIHFLWTYLLSENFNAKKDLFSNGTTMQAINNTNIKKIKTVIPEEKVLKSFNNLVRPMFETISNYKYQNIKLAQLRDTLLPKLMSGEIRVGQENLEEEQ